MSHVRHKKSPFPFFSFLLFFYCLLVVRVPGCHLFPSSFCTRLTSAPAICAPLGADFFARVPLSSAPMHASVVPNVVWVPARSDSVEYLRYEAMERHAHEASRAARAAPDRVRAPGAPLGAHHVRDMSVIHAQRPATPGAGLYLFPADDPVDVMPDDADALGFPPVVRGWLSDGEALAWLNAFYPHVTDTARTCMATCSGDRSLCACGVIDPAARTVRFYAVAARPSRRRKRKPQRGRIDH
nr:hypothetical protein [Pandoravirus massiliensis]